MSTMYYAVCMADADVVRLERIGLYFLTPCFEAHCIMHTPRLLDNSIPLNFAGKIKSSRFLLELNKQ